MRILLSDVEEKRERQVFFGRKWSSLDLGIAGVVLAMHVLSLFAPFCFNWKAFWVAIILGGSYVSVIHPSLGFSLLFCGSYVSVIAAIILGGRIHAHIQLWNSFVSQKIIFRGQMHCFQFMKYCKLVCCADVIFVSGRLCAFLKYTEGAFVSLKKTFRG